MPSISLQILRSDDPNGALRGGETIAIHDNVGAWRAVLIEHGMASGQPSVAIIVPVPGEHDDGAVAIFETSLLAFRAAARGLEAMAEAQLGWTLPD